MLAAMLAGGDGDLIAIVDREGIIPHKFSFNMAFLAYSAEHMISESLTLTLICIFSSRTSLG